MLRILILIATVLAPAITHASSGGAANEIGKRLSLWWTTPFITLLMAIAILPLWKKHWWEHNKNQAIVASFLGCPMLIWAFINVPGVLLHTGLEYFSFIVLISSLFIITGGIFISGDIRALPRVNAMFMAAGILASNFFATTGASMVFIRPLLRINSQRENVKHIYVFFIFAVANIAGCLLPIGDPPLFLGYLKGVPFFWTIQLFWPWLCVNSLLLVIFFVWDTIAYAGEKRENLELDDAQIEPLRIHGKWNIALLIGVILSVIFLPSIDFDAHFYWPLQEIGMGIMAFISLKITPLKGGKAEVDPREKNEFNLEPANEVAILFAGIFTTMIPALLILSARGGELGINQPWQFFGATGLLSMFLDNAPTYLNFLSLATGLEYEGADAILLKGDAPNTVQPIILQGISLGAVFFGAFTYIGNAPNFMIKSIVEKAGILMPSFFGFFGWSVVILFPIFIAMNYVYFKMPLLQWVGW